MEYIFIPCLTFFRSHEGAKLGENPVQIQKFEGIPRISGFELVLKRIWHSPEVSAMSGALWKSVPPGTNRPEMSYLGQDTFLVWFLVPNSTPQKLWRSFPKILFQFFLFFFHFFPESGSQTRGHHLSRSAELAESPPRGRGRVGARELVLAR